MRYQVGLFCIALSGQLFAINLSGLLTDNNQTQVSSKSRSPVVISTNLANSLMIADPDYQDAMNVLNDQNNARIYEDYLQSINHGFMEYYLTNIHAVQITARKPKTIDLAGLKSLSSQLVDQHAKPLIGINLNSISDIENISYVSPKHTDINLGALLNTDNVVAKTKKSLQSSSPNTSIQKTANSTPSVQVDTIHSKPKKTAKKKKRKAIDLSALLNE